MTAPLSIHSPVLGRSVGLLVCTCCRATVRRGGADAVRCPRCDAPLHVRKPRSLSTSAALLGSAAVLYVPANLLPVMRTHTLFDNENDTIMSGVLVLWQAGSWPLALLVLFASIMVPLLKLVSLGWILVAVARHRGGSALPRSKLFRFVEFIGRWSMLDIYAISLLVALVQIQSLADIHAGLGSLAFCAVVVLTMLAAQTFDERLIWDAHTDV